MIRCLLLGFALSTTILCAHGGDDATLVELKISGGQTVQCPFTEAGPIPAEKGPYKMEVAGFVLGQNKTGGLNFLIYTFGMDVGKNGSPTHIVVEDVTDVAAVILVDDKNPKVERKYWRGDAMPIEVSERTSPWVFEDTPTIKIFRITISAKDKPDVIMYQPSWYPVQSKSPIVQLVKRNRANKSVEVTPATGAPVAGVPHH